MGTDSPNRRVRDAATKPVLRAVIYVRVSSKRQTDTDADLDPDGNSIDTQRKITREKARALGAVVVDEYVEPAKSGQTLDKRPVFRDMMRRITEDRDVDVVIIYLRSRAFRNYVDAGNTEVALGKLGVKLESAKEEFGDGPMAEAMKAVTDVFNWLQVKMSGQDIKVKMANKARNGGTIGRAPLGYLNTTIQLDGHKVNTVAVDPERSKYVLMAFELWATGQYPNVAALQHELTKAGLRMPRTGKPISEQTLYNLLRDRYYLGYIEYEGIEYPGRHEPLIDAELFDQVTRVLDAHGGSGTRQRSHNHYLKALLWCARCRKRLIVQRARSRRGGEYYYWFCRGRQDGVCDLPYIPVEVLEDAVVAYYGDALSVPQSWLDQLQAGLDAAVTNNTDLDDALRAEFTKRLAVLDQREDYFLDLAAEENWPKDKLRTKIDAIRQERAEIEATVDRAEHRLDNALTIFRHAIDLLAEPQRAYETCNEAVRAMLNKAFFVRLYVDAGKITEHEAREPFDAIVGGYRLYQLGHAWNSGQPDAGPQTADSAAPLMEYGADQPKLAASPMMALAGHVRVRLPGWS